MKKITIALGLCIAMAMSATAQEKSILVYGGLDGFRNSANSEFKLDLGVGYQFDQNLTAGINIMSKSDGYTGGSAVNFMVGPFVRYTKPMTQLISLYGQAGFGFGSGTNITEMNFNLLPGAQLNIKQGWAIYMEFGNIGWSRTSVSSVATASTNYNLGRGLTFGIQKNIGGIMPKKMN
jgi:hypothetical protein